jgi:hypothetical protein
MPYKFTIVDRKTGRPIEGTVRFRSGSGVTPDAWDIPLLGAEVPEAVVESYDDVILSMACRYKVYILRPNFGYGKNLL